MAEAGRGRQTQLAGWLWSYTPVGTSVLISLVSSIDEWKAEAEVEAAAQSLAGASVDHLRMSNSCALNFLRS